MASPCRMGFVLSLLTIAVCASLLRVPEVEAARVLEADEKPCVRDVDCLFKHIPPCKGLLVCNHGKCDCLGAAAGIPISPALPPSDQANVQVSKLVQEANPTLLLNPTGLSN
ncbi:hypothetical protein M0R45_015196 [Rubus argutus]|uniref:Uncharacterized protein n=1 Tax=Rubus argutus TaxID=59490 RepID=A0AAW1XPV6_RUBAR